MQEMYSAGETAKRLGIPRYTLDYRIESGVFPKPRSVGNRRFWSGDEIEHLRQLLADYDARKGKSGAGTDIESRPE